MENVPITNNIYAFISRQLLLKVDSFHIKSIYLALNTILHQTKSESCAALHLIILCVLVTTAKSDLGYSDYLGKPFTNRAIMSGVLWLLVEMSRKRPVTPHSLSERGHIWHMCGPWDGKQGPRHRFPIRSMGDGIFIFEVSKRVFFVKQLQGKI